MARERKLQVGWSTPRTRGTCKCGVEVRAGVGWQLFQFAAGDSRIAPVEPPQHECEACWQGYIERRTAALAERKAQFAAMPRCEFCRRRALRLHKGEVYLCGVHNKIMCATYSQHTGALAMFFAEAHPRNLSAENIRQLARGETVGVYDLD